MNSSKEINPVENQEKLEKTNRTDLVKSGTDAYKNSDYETAVMYFREALEDLHSNHLSYHSKEYKDELAIIRYNLGSALHFQTLASPYSFAKFEAAWHLNEVLQLKKELGQLQSLAKVEAKISEVTNSMIGNVKIGSYSTLLCKAIVEYGSASSDHELQELYEKNYGDKNLDNLIGQLSHEDTAAYTYKVAAPYLMKMKLKQLMYLMDLLASSTFNTDTIDQNKLDIENFHYLILFHILSHCKAVLLHELNENDEPKDKKNSINIIIYYNLFAKFLPAVSSNPKITAWMIKRFIPVLGRELILCVDQIGETHDEDVDYVAFEYFHENHKKDLETFLKVSGHLEEFIPAMLGKKQDTLVDTAHIFAWLGETQCAEAFLRKAGLILNQRTKHVDRNFIMRSFYPVYKILVEKEKMNKNYWQALIYLQSAKEGLKDQLFFLEKDLKKLRVAKHPILNSLIQSANEEIENVKKNLGAIKKERKSCKIHLVLQNHQKLIEILNNIEGLTDPKSDAATATISFSIDLKKIRVSYLLRCFGHYGISCKEHINGKDRIFILDGVHTYNDSKIIRLSQAIEAFIRGMNHLQQEPKPYVPDQAKETSKEEKIKEANKEKETEKTNNPKVQTEKPSTKSKRKRRGKKKTPVMPKSQHEKEKEGEVQDADKLSKPYLLYDDNSKPKEVALINYSALSSLRCSSAEIKNLEQICRRGLLLFNSKGRKGCIKLHSHPQFTLKAKDASTDFRFFAIQADVRTVDGVEYPANEICAYSPTHKKNPVIGKRNVSSSENEKEKEKKPGFANN